MVELMAHNKEALEAIMEGLLRSSKVCVCNTTGSGKAYLSMALIERLTADNPEAGILYVTSYATNLREFREKVSKLIGEVPGLKTSIYSSLKPEQYKHMEMILLDEFHRAGAEEWGKSVKEIIGNNPGAKIIGFTATPVRYLDDGRDMAKELFDGNVVYELPLKDAIRRQILPCPHYTACLYKIDGLLTEYESRQDSTRPVQNPKKYSELLEKARRCVESADSIESIFKGRLDYPNGKYIVFCRNGEHMRKMEESCREWFADLPDGIAIYERYSSQGNDSEYQCFLNDNSRRLKLLFCINMLNEGPHIPDIDGAILLRPTESMNIYLQQIGRVLSASATRAPQVIDVVDNTSLMRQALNMWREATDIVKGDGTNNDKVLFDVSPNEIALLDVLDQMDALAAVASLTWDEWYMLAEKYFEEHGSLTNTASVKVDAEKDGREFQAGLGYWLARQRKMKDMLTDGQIEKLNRLGIVWSADEEDWQAGYEHAKAYRHENGDLQVKQRYRSGDGYALGTWISNKRKSKAAGLLSDEKIASLEAIGMVWNALDAQWEQMYKAAEEYYREFGDLLVGSVVEYKGKPLGSWISRQRRNYKAYQGLTGKQGGITGEQIERLNRIGMVWSVLDAQFEEGLKRAKEYYAENGNLRVAQSYVSGDGYRLGQYIAHKRKDYFSGRLDKEKIKALEKIGMIWNASEGKNDRGYAEAEAYYRKHGDLNVPKGYKTEDGYSLYNFLVDTRADYHKGQLTEARIRRLEALGFEWDLKKAKWRKALMLCEEYYAQNGNLNVPRGYVTKTGEKLGSIVQNLRRKRAALSPAQRALLSRMGMEFDGDSAGKVKTA